MADQTVNAIVALFDSADAAETTLERAQDAGIQEGILINRDAEGKVHQHLANLPDIGPAAAVGAGIGAIGAAIIVAILPEVALGVGLAAALAGAAGGSIIGSGTAAIKDEIVERRAFHDVAEELKPGQYALIVVMEPEVATAFEPTIQGALKVWSQELRSDDSDGEEAI